MDQLVVALDVDTAARARALADDLRGIAGAFKVGSRLFTSEGPALLADLCARGDRVFLDLKFHDIPTTVAGAVSAAGALGVWMVNVHALGGRAMMQAARDAAHEAAARSGLRAPLVTAVTMLTSMSQHAITEVGIERPIVEEVEWLAGLAEASGLDGVVASPLEVAAIRRRCSRGFVIVTPGIRGGAASSAGDDQSRTMTAAEALSAGATYIVVGRPIIGAPDPRTAAERIADECRHVVAS